MAHSMTRWAKDATEFNVVLLRSTNLGGSKTCTCRVPRPIVERLGNPKRLKFRFYGQKVVVEGTDKK